MNLNKVNSITVNIKREKNKSIYILILLLTFFLPGNLFASGSNPTVDFDVDDTTPVVGQVVKFTDKSDAGTNNSGGSYTITSRNWDFGDGNTSTQTNPSNSYLAPGFYEVSLEIVTNGNGTVSKPDYITVYGTYYYNGSGDPAETSSWNTEVDGTGYAPVSFTSGYQSYIIRSGQTCSTAKSWSLNGDETKIIIESGATFSANHEVSLPTNATFQIDNGGTYQHNNNSTTVWGGTVNIGNTSTVSYGYAGDQVIEPLSYGNLTVTNGGHKTLQGATTVDGTLDLSGANIVLGTNNLTLAGNASITGSFSSSNMIVTNGTGRLIKEGNANADYQMVYPIGTDSYYTPYEISSISCSNPNGAVQVRAVAGIAPVTPSTEAEDLQKYWEVTAADGLTITSANVSFTYDNAEVGSGGNKSDYALLVYSGGAWVAPAGASVPGANPMSASGVADISGIWTAVEQSPQIVYYSYRSGNWNDVSTWTHDPGGTTHTATDIPGDDAKVIILNGRTVSMTTNVSNTNLSVAIMPGAFLNMGAYQFTNVLTELSGQGTLKLSSADFPSITDNYFVTSSGGTVEFNNSANFELPASQSEYNHLIINGSAIATQKHNLDIHGNLIVKQGTYRINDDTNARYQLSIDGNVTVVSGASLTVGTGNTTSGGNVGGGTAPFINYYTTYTHTIVVNGDFTNDGTVRFTNQSYPQYGAFPVNGAATVYFRGPADNTLTCNGQTDFYNLVLDKGTDQTFKLNIYSSAYHNFRLFGRNSYDGDTSSTGGTEQNPNLRKALWIRTGTLVLKGLTVIPSLSEGGDGGTPNSDFYIPVNGALVLDGPDVVVLATADDYTEVNAAYGLSGGSNSAYSINEGSAASSFSIYGKVQINGGYFSTRESGGFITWDKASGEFIVNGGTVDAKQFRAAGGADGLASYTQTGGTVILRGQFQRSTSSLSAVSDLVNAPLDLTRETNGLDDSKGTLNINNPDNIFSMSGGTLKILGLCGTSNGYAIDIFSDKKNINVSGGIVEIAPQKDNYTFKVRSAASFGNLVVNRAAGNSQVQLDNSNLPTGVTVTGKLDVLGDITLTSGTLNANNFDVTVGGDFSLALGTVYTTGSNKTIFNGTEQQKLIMEVSSLSLNKLEVDKSSNELLLSGSLATLNVTDSLIIKEGDLNCDAKNLTASGHIYNAGRQLGTGSGRISMLGSSPKTISGDGQGEFYYLKLNTGNNQNITVNADIKINHILQFSKDLLLDIGANNIAFSEAAKIQGASSVRYIKTAGNVGDGGVSFVYNSTVAKTWPIGVDVYSPATIGFSGTPTSYGNITIVPVNYEHPTTTTDNQALQYFWRVKSEGFTGVDGKVTHKFVYNDTDVKGTESYYRPARYDATTYTWNKGQTSNVEESTHSFTDWTTPTKSADHIDGDYTAGQNSAFGTPKKYFSRQSGYWYQTSTWSTVSHTGIAASDVPGTGDIVIIGSGHEVSLYRYYANTKNEDPRNCASLQIETGASLDVAYSPASDFGMVMSHPSGNGTIKISTQYNSDGIFEFPSGDFSDFNANSGTTELYTINNTSGTTYYLPNGVLEYGNLIIHPVGGSNIIFPNHDVEILGNLTTQGTSAHSWFSPAWWGGGWNEKTITVKGNLNLEGGSLFWGGNGTVRQDVVVEGNVVVANGAGIGSQDATNQSLTIGGNFINNSSADLGSGSQTGCYLIDIPLIFTGDTNAKITSTAGAPETTFGTITVNKGTSQATTLTMDIGGTITFNENEWLKLQNGTFVYKSAKDVALNSNNSFVIPGSAGLEIEMPLISNYFVIGYNENDDYDVYLDGKISVKEGRLYIGYETRNSNNDIEYSGGGLSEIDVQGGALYVNGQIRRNPASSAGILKYNQSGGTVTINGRNARADRAKLEILNAGSAFNMSGGTLTIVRGGGTTFGDLYLRPETSAVTGGNIVFKNTGVGTQNYLLDANVPLNNLTVTGDGNNAAVQLLLSPLELNGDLTLSNSRSIFDANAAYDIAVTIKGDFNNSGTYNYRKNTTTFSGVSQQITGSSSVEFYNLIVNPTTELILNKDVTINNELAISSGNLTVGAYTINAKGNVINNSAYTSTGNGLVLNGSVVQELSGTGAYARVELNNNNGATLANDLSIQGDLALTKGILNIKNHLLSLGETTSVSGTFGVGSMITTNGVYSNKGVKKVMPAGVYSFTFPLGVAGKYTPAVVDLSANGGTASIQIHPVNAKHPANIDAANVLNYYWAVKSEALSHATGSLKLTYVDDDVQGDETQYYGARLLVPGTSWTKNHPVDEATNVVSFAISGDDISGEYTAGLQSAFPDNVPEYTSNGNGVWSNPANWVQTGGDSYTLTGAPNGFIVVIKDEITLNENFANAYRTTISSTGKLKIDGSTYGHNLGTVSGNGTLYLEDGQLPEGDYTAFLGCSNNSTLEFGGTAKDYSIIGDLFNNAANLVFSGTGTRTLPDADLTVCKQLVIDGPVLDNSVYNRTLYVNGSFTRLSGQFKSGSGASATVAFVGSAEQYVGGFTGADNAFNNLEVNNAAGLTLNGVVEVTGNLLLTNGLINTTSVNTLTITNTAINCVTPSAGKSSSYVNGPLTKQLNQGDSFIFPIGKDGVLGNKLTISSTRTGTKLWTAEYVRPNATAANFAFPLTAINNHEYYTVSTPGGGEAMVQLGWDSGSDITPSMTEHGLTDIRVVNYDGANWQEIASTATGTDTNGHVITKARVSVSATGTDFTIATVNTNKPKVRFNPDAAICGLTTGIKVEMTTTVPTAADYELSYTINGGAVQTVTVNAFPYYLLTPSIGVYELTDFKYDNKVRTGVVDPTTIEVFASPTTANAGTDQSLQGLSQTTLDANTAVVGVGQWRIVSGTGGSFVDPSNPKTVFNGTNGSAYELSWTITNGDCESVDIVNIAFPLLPPHTWVGGVSSDWFDTNNWTDKIIPDDTHDVTINAVTAPAVDPVIDGAVLAEVGDLAIEAGASLTVKPGARLTISGNLITNNGFVIENSNDKPASVITNGTVTGNVTSRWSYSELHWWFIGHSISNPQVDTYRNIVVADPTNKYALYDYAASGKLLNRGADAAFDFTTTYADANEVIRGYQFKVLKPVTIEHTGVLNNAASYSKDVQNGWQIIANPYPAYYELPVDNGDFAETKGTIYITKARTNADKTFEAFNTNSGIKSPSDFDGVIAPSQAFYVETVDSPAAGAKITMRASQCTNGSTMPTLKSGAKPNRKILRLKLSNQYDLTDEAVIALYPNGQKSMTRLDSKQRFYNGTNYSYIYSIVDDIKAVINVLPDELVDYQQVIGIQTKAGKQTLRISGLESISDEYQLVLEDKTKPTPIPITNSTVYEFTAEEGIDHERFVLHFITSKTEVPTDINDVNTETSEVSVFVKNHTSLNVNCDWNVNTKTVAIYAVSGALILNDEFSGESYETELNVQPGIYIVKISAGDRHYQEKVMIQ